MARQEGATARKSRPRMNTDVIDMVLTSQDATLQAAKNQIDYLRLLSFRNNGFQHQLRETGVRCIDVLATEEEYSRSLEKHCLRVQLIDDMDFKEWKSAKKSLRLGCVL